MKLLVKPHVGHGLLKIKGNRSNEGILIPKGQTIFLLLVGFVTSDNPKIPKRTKK